MSSVILTGDTSGTLTVSAPLVAGSNTVTLPAATGTISLLTRATAVASTSGTSIDFTSIPSWAKRITVVFNAVGTNGTSIPLIQIGDSGGIENTGYIAAIADVSSVSGLYTAGVPLNFSTTAADVFSGTVTLINITSDTWIFSTVTMRNAPSPYHGNGNKTLSATLDRVRITTVSGTDTFDAGSINIMYEG